MSRIKERLDNSTRSPKDSAPARSVGARRGRPPRPHGLEDYDSSRTPPPFGVNLFERMLDRAARKIGRRSLSGLAYLVRDHAPDGDRTVSPRAEWLRGQVVGVALSAIERHAVKTRRKADPYWPPHAMSEARAGELAWAGAVIEFQKESKKFKAGVRKELKRDPLIRDHAQAHYLVASVVDDIAPMAHERGRRVLPAPRADDQDKPRARERVRLPGVRSGMPRRKKRTLPLSNARQRLQQKSRKSA